MAETLEKESNDQKQCSRRNCILVHGVEERKDEITDDLVVNSIKDAMDIEPSVKDIDRNHQIENPSPRKKRHITVKFVRCNDHRKFFSNEKKL